MHGLSALVDPRWAVRRSSFILDSREGHMNKPWTMVTPWMLLQRKIDLCRESDKVRSWDIASCVTLGNASNYGFCGHMGSLSKMCWIECHDLTHSCVVAKCGATSMFATFGFGKRPLKHTTSAGSRAWIFSVGLRKLEVLHAIEEVKSLPSKRESGTYICICGLINICTLRTGLIRFTGTSPLYGSSSSAKVRIHCCQQCQT